MCNSIGVILVDAIIFCYNTYMKTQLGSARDMLATGLSATGAEIVIESNVTPEIIIDLAAALSPSPPDTAVSGSNELALKLIQPEIEVSTLQGALRHSIAPYGKPRAGMFSMLILSTAIAGLIGAAIAWNICRNRIGVSKT